MASHVTLQADVDGLPVMPLALYDEALMTVPNLAEFSASDDGAGVEAEILDPRWDLTIRASGLSYDDYMALKGWAQRVRSLHAGRFLGFDPRTRRPRAYDAAVVPPSPTLSANIPQAPPRLVPLAGLGNGYKLSAGDRLGYVSTTGVRTTHEIVADVTANSGGAATVSVLPRILLAAASGTAVSLDRPLQLFHMVPGSFEHSLAIHGEIAFRAVSINRVLAAL